MSSYPSGFPPVITTLSPSFAIAGGNAFTLTLNGQNFGSDAIVYWGLTAITPVVVSANQLTAAITAAMILAAGAVNVTVASGGFTSQAFPFGVTQGPSPLDLCTVGQVKSWLSANGAPASADGDDNNMQICITSAGYEWLLRTGNGPSDGVSVPATSPFVQVCSFGPEFYDGSGSDQQFLRHFPIVSVQLLQINSVQIPQSNGWGSLGWVISPGMRSLILRNGSNSAQQPNTGSGTYYYWNDLAFTKGSRGNRLNVKVQYSAGYGATPPDITEHCIEMVAATYRKRDFIEQSSQAMASGAGTVRYRDWELSPGILKCMRRYARLAAV
jgi:IPT/TIG domain